MTDVHCHDELVPFRLRGELDMATTPEWRVQLWAYTATSEGDVVCDCTDLEFLDSSGIAMLLQVQRELHALDRDLCLFNVIGVPRRALEACGLSEQFGVIDEPPVVLTPPAIAVLRHLCEFRVTSVWVDAPGMSGAVARDALDELETASYVRRVPTPNGRPPMFVITAAGRRKASRLESGVDAGSRVREPNGLRPR
jgi:anti-sigma B factor antagonist